MSIPVRILPTATFGSITIGELGPELAGCGSSEQLMEQREANKTIASGLVAFLRSLMIKQDPEKPKTRWDTKGPSYMIRTFL